MPLDSQYMFLIIYMRSVGSCRSSIITYHNLRLFIESYARFKSMNNRPSLRFDWRQYCTNVCSISACSTVL